jgi:hypothetical protein
MLCSTFYIKDADEKLAARKAVVEGTMGVKLAKLDAILVRWSSGLIDCWTIE